MARQRARKDWNEVRSAYRKGEGSLRDLAQRFGISASAVMKRAAREGWEAERQRVESRAQEKATDRDVESLAAMLGKHRRIANRLLELAEKRLAEAKVTANMLDTVATVLQKAARQERLAAGIEPAKPVMAFATAGAGAVLRVKRRRHAEVPEAKPAAEQAAAAGTKPPVKAKVA